MIAPDGARFLEGGRSVPIGAADPAVFREATAILPPGASLLLYTDGLVERRDTPLEDRLDELADAAATGGDELGELCEHVIARCSARATRATTWRSSPCGRCRWPTPRSA